MQSVEFSQLDKFTRKIDRVLKEGNPYREKALSNIGDMTLRMVRKNIAMSLNDSRGHIRSYQAKYIGRYGGYVAVRAITTRKTGKNSPGAITNYLENGHITRPRRIYRKRPKGKIYVNGYHFYDDARREIEGKAIAELEKMTRKMCDELGSSL